MSDKEPDQIEQIKEIEEISAYLETANPNYKKEFSTKPSILSRLCLYFHFLSVCMILAFLGLVIILLMYDPLRTLINLSPFLTLWTIVVFGFEIYYHIRDRLELRRLKKEKISFMPHTQKNILTVTKELLKKFPQFKLPYRDFDFFNKIYYREGNYYLLILDEERNEYVKERITSINSHIIRNFFRIKDAIYKFHKSLLELQNNPSSKEEKIAAIVDLYFTPSQ